MEVSALRYQGGIGLHGRSPLLRLQSDERLISLVRRGNPAAFEVLVARYQARLLAFCRHLLGSREDAEDVLQEALAAAFNAILGDDRPINVRPWLYRIARNRCLNHLRRIQAVGVDSMDVHLSEHGATTADKVHSSEEFWMLVGDIRELPETQKTALVLREMDALSYEQIAEAMETTVPSVKSLLVRARVSLAEAAEARMLSCEEVRVELAEAVEGLRKKTSPVVRRHLRACERCSIFQVQLKETSKALTAVLPVGPLVILKKLALAHLGHSAGSSATGATAAGQAAAVGSTAAAGSAVVGSAGGVISLGAGTIATKAAAGLAAAALVTAGAVDLSHVNRPRHAAVPPPAPTEASGGVTPVPSHTYRTTVRGERSAFVPAPTSTHHKPAHAAHKPAVAKKTTTTTAADNATKAGTARAAKHGAVKPAKKALPVGRTETQTQTTVLASGQSTASSTTPTPTGFDPASAPGATTWTDPATTSTGPATTSSSPPSSTGTDPGTTTPGPTSTPSTPAGGAGDPGSTTPSSSGGAPPSSGGASPQPSAGAAETPRP
jgi:RNA polymerase sigma factor (sigma-70 family)